MPLCALSGFAASLTSSNLPVAIVANKGAIAAPFLYLRSDPMHTHPKWKYHATLPAIMVADEHAEDALGKGWFDTPAEAEASIEVDDDSAEQAEIYRKELLAKAKELGISIHHMSGVEKIQAAIDEHNA